LVKQFIDLLEKRYPRFEPMKWQNRLFTQVLMLEIVSEWITIRVAGICGNASVVNGA